MAIQINFTLINGKYIADGDGSEISTELLMDNMHEINGDHGYVLAGVEKTHEITNLKTQLGTGKLCEPE